MVDVDEALRKLLFGCRLMSGMGPADARELLARARPLSWKDGEVLFSEGDDGGWACVVVSGSVDVKRKAGRRGQVALATIGPGESFGEMSLVRPGKRSASAVGGRAGTGFVIDASCLPSMPGAAFHLVRAVARVLADRLATASDTIVFQSQLPGVADMDLAGDTIVGTGPKRVVRRSSSSGG